MQTRTQADGILGYLSLFTSLGTLLCCALPSVLVLLGLGATVASAVTAAPWLITLSRHKGWTFIVAGLLIATNFFYVFLVAPKLRAGGQACPADQPSACSRATRADQWILWFSTGVYLAGFFSAYLLGPILRYIG